MANDFNGKVMLSTIMDEQCLFGSFQPMTHMAMVVLISTSVICALALDLQTFTSQESYSTNNNHMFDMA